MPLKTVQELMTKWIGPNWKTTVNGYLAAMMWICGTLIPILTPYATSPGKLGKAATISVTVVGVLSTICRIVVGRLQIDSKPKS